MLRAFEATARHGSMSRAAIELNVTHGAVSRQVVALERFLEVQLFRRRSRGVELTEQGVRLFHGVSAGFDRIRITLADLRNDRRQRPVTVTTLPTFASRWLLPKLAAFHGQRPDIVVNLRTGTDLDDLADPGVDFAIRYGTGAWPNTTADLLLSANAYPVCSPAFLETHGPIERPGDLLDCPLIHNVTRQWWIDWFVAAGLELTALTGGIVVDEYGLAIQFALDGYGVVLARDPLLDRELDSGALVRLFDIKVTPHFAYYLTRDVAKVLHPEADLLMRWLLSQADAPPPDSAGRAGRSHAALAGRTRTH
ncbi:MAG: LysR substrate-binding domain-containing protein [Alphaproteobacteria bacterium]|nr:LysR substrate-binding domain-containing protein [Alphaproteobacteria bacterium]